MNLGRRRQDPTSEILENLRSITCVGGETEPQNNPRHRGTPVETKQK